MAATLGTLNPFRYRSYVYDQETHLYYLQSRYYNPQWGRFINADGQISGVGGDIVGYNLFAYCMNNPVNMSDPTGDWPISLLGVFAVRLGYACVNNVISSKKGTDYEAVRKLLKNKIVEPGNVRLPADTEGLLYNKENRLYASEIIKEDLGVDSQRTISNISSEIFAHQFVADVVKPLSILSGKIPAKWDIYQRLSKADIDETEDRIKFFDFVEEVFKWE